MAYCCDGGLFCLCLAVVGGEEREKEIIYKICCPLLHHVHRLLGDEVWFVDIGAAVEETVLSSFAGPGNELVGAEVLLAKEGEARDGKSRGVVFLCLGVGDGLRGHVGSLKVGRVYVGEAEVASGEVGAEALGLEDAMLGQAGVGDSGEELAYIVLGFAVPDEEYLHREEG